MSVTIHVRMSVPLLAELDALAAQLVQRRWVARAALVNDAGEVSAMHSARASSERENVHDVTREPLTPVDPVSGVARMVVERLEDQTWIYVDLGTLRLLARLARASHASAATAWLARELGRMGFTVERETLAQD